jgi:hypothetical protein
MLFGFMVKLNEAAKGNFESLRGMSLESVLDVRNSPHSQLSTCQEQLCENDTKNQGSTRDADESTIANEVVNRQSKKRAAMPPANNHGKMLKSLNMIIMDSTRRKGSCSLCWVRVPQAKGMKCPFVEKYNAISVDSKDVPKLPAEIRYSVVLRSEEARRRDKTENYAMVSEQ